MGDAAPFLRVVSKFAPNKPSYRIACNEAVQDYVAWSRSEPGKMEKVYGGMGRTRLVQGLEVKGPKLFITEDCPALIESITSLQRDPNSLNGLDYIQGESINDHSYSALKMALMSILMPYKLDKEFDWQERFARRSKQEVGWRAGDP